MTDIVVVGAGPAGIRAAEVLAENGQRPILIDEGSRSGGQIYRRPPKVFQREARDLYGFEARQAKKLHATADTLCQKIEYIPETSVWSATPSQLNVVTEGHHRSISFDRLIIATGAMDRILPFHGWTTPGVYALGAGQVALKYQSCLVGKNPVFFGTGPLLYLVAYQYAKAGANVGVVLDTSPRFSKIASLPGMTSGGSNFLKGLYYAAWLVAHRVPVHAGTRPVRVVAGDDGGVSGFLWKDSAGRERQTGCDAVCTGFGLRSETQLADLCEAEFVFDALQRQWLPKDDGNGRTTRSGVYLAGDSAQIRGARAAEISGRRAAYALLADLGDPDALGHLRECNRSLEQFDRFRNTLEAKAFPFPVDIAASAPDDLTICRCEGVTAGEIRDSVNVFGASEINRTKAFTRTGMGRCQGRICGAASAEIVAAARGIDIGKVGRMRGQAPIKPVRLSTFMVNEAAP